MLSGLLRRLRGYPRGSARRPQPPGPWQPPPTEPHPGRAGPAGERPFPPGAARSLGAAEAEARLDRARAALREAFTPARPQRGGRRLIGRRAQLARMLRALQEERSHVVLYAERGRGKTSLANVLVETLRTGECAVARHACGTGSDFCSILRALARDLPATLLAAPLFPSGDQDREGQDGCAAALPPPGRPVQPEDVVALPGRLTARSLVLVVDEFDRIADGETRTRFADTIKQLSDRGAPLLFVIVGVSDSLEALLGRHPSIQRNVLGIPLPLLSTAEIAAILDRGGEESGLAFAEPVRRSIAIIARGVPYMAQLLALRAGQAALERGTLEVGARELKAAMATVVEEADPRIVALYDVLTGRGRDAAAVAALLAMAGGQFDRFGRVLIEEEEDRMAIAAGTAVPLALLERLAEGGAIRPCAGLAPGLFTFAEPLLPHYVLMRAFLADAQAAPSAPGEAAAFSPGWAAP